MGETTDLGNILIVDDTPDNLALLSNILKSAGYRVRPAPSGALALRAARHNPPDLILLDINMPEMNGFEVCRRLKADDTLKSIPVLFISALTDTADKIEAFRAGGLDYITKPFQAQEVLARVETHLNIRRYQLALNEKSSSLQKALEELKAAQTRLVQSEKMASLGVLTAGIAHEINNPINFMKTSAHALRQDMADVKQLMDAYDRCTYSCSDNELCRRVATVKADIDYDVLSREVPTLVTNITTGVERTEEIVNSLLLYARADSRRKILVALDDLIEKSLTLLQNRYKDSIHIKKQLQNLPPVPAQPGRLLQVINNVLDNAIDAAKENRGVAEPVIEIQSAMETRDSIEYAVIAVRDSGSGIDAENMGKVFDPFFTTKEIGRGIGLGMSISYGIVRDHDGHIDICNDPEGGTTVSIFLPKV